MDLYNNFSSGIYVQYEIYNPYDFSYIPLDICQNVTININTPINLNKETEDLYISLSKSGYNLFNPKNSFYNDICATYTTENGTDITLFDRKKLMFDKNKNTYLCQAGCIFESYNDTTKKSKCNCNVQNKLMISNIKELKFDKKQIVDNFLMSSLKNSNFKVVKCYKLIFSKKGQTNNIGSYILIFIIIILFICMICSSFLGHQKINQYIELVIKQKFMIYDKNSLGKKITIFKTTKRNNTTIKNNFKKSKNIKRNNTQNKEKNKKLKKKIIDKKVNKKDKKKLKSKRNPPKKIKDHSLRTNSISFKNDISSIQSLNQKDFSKNHKNNKLKLTKRVINKSKGKSKDNIVKYKSHFKTNNNNDSKSENKNIIRKEVLNDEEMNSLKYELALDLDKRNYLQYYFSLLKKKQLILFTFLSDNDYNLIFIKVALLFLSFALYFTINSFFFTDSTMHKITVDNGEFDFIFQIPQILYSTIISTVINMILKKLSLSELQILSLKKEKDLKSALVKGKKINNYIKIKFILFFVLSFTFSFFFWYFISGFCAVYKNTQKTLIKNTLFSFALSMIYPFGLNLLPGMLRIPALRAPKRDRNCLYTFSGVVAII